MPIDLQVSKSTESIYVDKNIFTSVLFNLAQNAVEHISLQSCDPDDNCVGGPFRIWVKLARKDQNLIIFVCNTGSKMLLDLDDIFAMGASGKPYGTGTGLHYSKSKLRELNCYIEYINKENADCTFKITAPMQGENHDG